MAYGIRIESGNGSLQIDSDTSNVGTIITDRTASSSSVTYDSNQQLVFARPASGGSSVSCGLSQAATINPDGTLTRTFRKPGGDNSLVSMEILLVEFASNLTASTTGYGIQIFNTDGDLAYDSEALNGDGGFNITDYFPAGSQNGAGYTYLTTDPRAFAVFNHTSIGPTNEDFYSGYTFDDNNVNNDGITWFSFLNVNTGDLGIISSFFDNFSPLLLGERGAG